MTAGYARPEALVSIDWLAAHLDDEEVRVLDGSFHLPGSGRCSSLSFLVRTGSAGSKWTLSCPSQGGFASCQQAQERRLASGNAA